MFLLLLSLVAAYSFDEGSGTVVLDALGNNGTLQGPTWTDGKYGNALLFDGSSYVFIPDSDSLDITSELTIEAWVFPTEFKFDSTIVDKTTTGIPSNYFLSLRNGEVNFGFFSGSFSMHTTSGVNLIINTWYHVAATYSDALDNVSIYVNGVEVLSDIETQPLTTNDEELRIGISYSGGAFMGKIDNLRIYDEALSAGEIQEKMGLPVLPLAPHLMITVTP